MKGYEILLNELRKIEKGWKVKDLMTTDVKTIDPDATVNEAIKVMKEHGIHGLVVTKNENIKGIITTYDALLVMAKGVMGHQVLVKEVMSSRLISIEPGKDVLDALELMLDNQLTKLPVISGTELKGILSATDLIDAFEEGAFEEKPRALDGYRHIKLTVGDVMQKPVVIESDKTAYDAARSMTEHDTGSVLIKHADSMGIITEKDIFKKVVAEGKDPKKTPVTDIMSALRYMVPKEESIGSASKIFSENNIRRIPVTDKGEIVGVVSTKDIAKTIAIRHRL